RRTCRVRRRASIAPRVLHISSVLSGEAPQSAALFRKSQGRRGKSGRWDDCCDLENQPGDEFRHECRAHVALARLSPVGRAMPGHKPQAGSARMKLCVVGLWHLGCVTASCLADHGHDVVAVDPDAKLIAELRQGRPPLHEPGLAELLQKGLAAGCLRFETSGAHAAGADIVWITFDTPVDEDDMPLASVVVEHVTALLEHVSDGGLVLISSQLPVGTTRQLAAAAAKQGRRATFAYSPENLRLGRAIKVFTRPDRVVVGLQTDDDRQRLAALFAPFTSNLIWMGIEAA